MASVVVFCEVAENGIRAASLPALTACATCLGRISAGLA
jgi:hypothetical protein